MGRTTFPPSFEMDSCVQAATLLPPPSKAHIHWRSPNDRIRRTLERRVRQWRLLNGPRRDIIFRQ